MSHIQLLSENVCNRIAAGEVVERPASVVKELVENSLDAGASRISVAVEEAGKKSISVLDNGAGMDEDDALLCFESHATSKIRNEEDIFAIQSFGFRGEAIPSIASVAKMTIRTRRKENSGGYEVVVHGGKAIASNPVGCAPGTEVRVRELFYNIPARKKFLKTAATEEHHIVECVTNIALANPQVTFELKADGRTVFLTPGNADLLPRIREIFGKSTADILIPVNAQSGSIRVHGYISKRDHLRNTRSEQRTFVNGRPVESLSIYRGIREGYGPILEKGKYPAAILFVDMEPGMVDVNVHPAKREVRFRDDFGLVSAVRSAVTAALRAADEVIPQRGENIPPSAPSGHVYIPQNDSLKEAPGDRIANSLYPDFRPGAAETDGFSELELIMKQALVEYHVAGSAQATPALQTLSELIRQQDQPAEDVEPSQPVNYLKLQQDRVQEVLQQPDVLPFSDPAMRDFPQAKITEDQLLFSSYKLKLLGIMENSYIIGVIANGLVLIDQHAAHERVLFEKLLKRTDGSLSQKLLLPITLELSRANMQFVLRNRHEFENAGFEIDPFGDHTVKINAIPAALPQDNAGGIFLDMLDRILESGSAQQLQLHQIATAACKAAVKAHDRLTMEECDALIRELANCELPFSCPHGRPTVLNISLNEIERRFGRK